MKKGLFIVLTLILVLSVSMVAIASISHHDITYGPAIEITTPTGHIYVGEQFSVTATTSVHAGPSAVEEEYWIDNWNTPPNNEHAGSRQKIDRLLVPNPDYDPDDPASEEFLELDCWVNTLMLTAPMEAGSYTLQYYIKMQQTAGPNTIIWQGDDQKTIVVMAIDIEVECPAAPAIAANLLRNNEVKGRAFGRYLFLVAHEMGSHEEDLNGSMFWGLDKCSDGQSNPAYFNAVDQFLRDKGAY